jgi:hypothetical protein
MIKLIVKAEEIPRPDGKGKDFSVELYCEPAQLEPHVTSMETKFISIIKQAVVESMRELGQQTVADGNARSFYEREDEA